MTKRKKTIIIISSTIVLIAIGFLFFLRAFVGSFAPPKITISKNFIKTNRSFINGVSIEKLDVDSMGAEGYPLKYTSYYSTSCRIHHPANKPPDPPDKIEFSKPGKYSWDEDTIPVRYVHQGLSRQALDTASQLWWLNKFGKHPVCPISFEKQQWYFITISDPQVTGIFFYIDSSGKEHQYFLPSGVSPI